MIRIDYNLRTEDMVALSCHYYDKSPSIQQGLRASQIVLTMLFACGGLFFLTEIDHAGPIGIALLAVAGYFAVFWPSRYRARLRKGAERLCAEGSYAKACGPCTLTLTEEGLSSQSPLGEGKYHWTAVDRVVLTPKYLFIYLAGPMGYVISRAHTTDALLVEAKTFADAHLPHDSQ